MTYEIVDSDVIHGNLTMPLPAGNTETFVVRARPEHYHSSWWYGVEVTHSGGRMSRKSNLVQAVVDHNPVGYTAPKTTTPSTATTTPSTATTTIIITTTTTTTIPATTEQSYNKEDSYSPVICYASIGWNVALLIILSFIIGRILYQRRKTAIPQDKVEVDNVQLHSVEEAVVVHSHTLLENFPHDNVDEAVVVDLNELSDNVPHDNVDEAVVVELHDLSDNVPHDNVDEAVVVN